MAAPQPYRSTCLAASVLAAMAGLLLVSSGCDSSAPAASELPAPKVTTMAVVLQETIDADEYQGQTEASETVEVRARVFGYLKTIDFNDGDFVKGPVLGPGGEVQEEGQILFTIEPDEYDAIHKQSLARIDLNQANLTLAKAKHARNATLVKSGAVTQEEFEESAAAVASAEAAITAAKADANRTAVDLKYTVIRAPIDGRIDRAMVSVGNLLTGGMSSGTLLTKIVKESPMYVYFDVDERSLLRYMRRRAETRQTAPGSLRDLGIPIYLQLADETEFSHEGTLDFVETEVSRTTGTARIRGVFANTDRTLASGLFVRVQIPVSEPYQALLLPEAALATDQNIKYVYVVAGGKAERRNVELGGQRGDMRIITSGLKEGDQVIVKGLQRVKPGQQVEAEQAAAPEMPPTTVRKPVTPPTSPEPPAKEEIDPGPVETAPATSTPRTRAQER
ncbi:MAG TPA: efflux RND transporter periplasmic adaptor subunit [Pirellulaceae bacterium]|nr:efflux RND transporter periplasmic adaptor subunit [Pirellulaceae bacterium]